VLSTLLVGEEEKESERKGNVLSQKKKGRAQDQGKNRFFEDSIPFLDIHWSVKALLRPSPVVFNG
jgi:hypothetical protein